MTAISLPPPSGLSTFGSPPEELAFVSAEG